MASGNSKIIAIAIIAVSFLAFFTGFRYNAWHVLKDGRYLDTQAESMVMGRLVKSRTDGIFSSGGLCGRCQAEKKDTALFNYQYKAFTEDIPCNRFYPYLSQIGFNAVIYSLIDRASPFTSATDLELLRSFKSGMLALVLSLVVLWFFLEMGIWPAVFVFSGIFLTPWITFMGRDLWFCVWTNFIPFVAALFLLRKEYCQNKPSGPVILLLTILAILFNFIYNGYEWVTTTLIMASVPFFYYWRIAAWPMKKLLRRISWLIAGSIAAALATFSILVYQISLVKGSFSEGIDWIIFSFQKRSYGGAEVLPEVFEKQLHHSIWEVFLINLGGMAFRFPRFISDHVPRYFGGILNAEILFLLVVITFLVFYRRNLLKISSDKINFMKNLVITTWISLLAPFSWFVIFKGHAWSHFHINYITWWMPFGLFAMALIGMTIKFSYKNLILSHS